MLIGRWVRWDMDHEHCRLSTRSIAASTSILMNRINRRPLIRMFLPLIRYVTGFSEFTEVSDFMRTCQSETLLTEKPTIRSPNAMPPLLQRLTERKPESLDYLGVSYGLTPQLLRYVPDILTHCPHQTLGTSDSGNVLAIFPCISAKHKAS